MNTGKRNLKACKVVNQYRGLQLTGSEGEKRVGSSELAGKIRVLPVVA